MKTKKLAKLARKVERMSIKTEDLADLVQHRIPTRVLLQLREAVRSLDDATFYLDEAAARK